MKRFLTGAMTRSAIIAMLCSLSWSAYAIADNTAKHPVNIPAQSLAGALRELSRQSGTDLIYRPEQVRGFRTPGLIGTYSAEQAVTRLIQGTPLAVSMDPTGALLIAAPLPAGGGPRVGGGVDVQSPLVSRSTGDSLHLAQAAPGESSRPPSSARERTGSVSRAGQTTAGSTLEEIVVTAQKYRQRAIDVPISMTIIGGPELQRLGISNLEGLQFLVPGMLVENDGNTMRITINGISNAFGQGALVGTYLDEADVTSEVSEGLDLDPYDLQRVEVLKGPQGTLYGEGSLGGTIRYITNRPALDQFQMLTYAAAVFDQYGAPGDRVEAVVNAPLVPGLFGMRVAADLDQEGGWIDQPAANLKNINSKNLADARIESRWQPREDLTVDAMEVIHRETSGPVTGEDPIGIYTQVFGLMTTPRIEDNFNITNLTLNWDPGPVSVVNSSTYFTHRINELNFGAAYQFTPPPSQRLDSYAPSAPITDESVSDELRIAGAQSARWRWMVGGFYKHLNNDEPPLLNYFGVPGPPGSPLPAPIAYFSFIYSKSTSLFGDSNYRLGRLVVGAGLRYFKDDESAFIEGDPQQEVARFTSTDPRFYARYEVSRNVNLYMSAAKGFRSGGFNGYGYPQFQPEHVWTYDLGTKMSLFQGRFGLNSDVFLSNYGAYQIIGVLPPPDPPFSITGNAGNARIKGIESDVTWRPAERWRLAVSGDYINARFVSIAAQGSSFNVGDPLDLVPRYQVTASTERSFVWQGRTGFARVDYTQRSRETFRARDIGPWYYSQSDYMYLLGFNTGIDWTSNLELGLFVQNVLNDRGYTGSDVIETYAAREQPRTFGVDFRAKFQ